ncbi:hypothetical protein Droror1_Dr00018523 [Drosera rotundifolia]
MGLMESRISRVSRAIFGEEYVVIREILAIAKVPSAVNQVEVNPFWQQKKLIEFCKEIGVLVTAYSPLGAIGTFYGSNRVLECEVLKDITKAKGKTISHSRGVTGWPYISSIGPIKTLKELWDGET